MIKNITQKLKKQDLLYIFEPGRFLVANTGVLLAKIITIKHTEYGKFAILDAGMNNLIRVALYDAYHEIIPLKCSGVQEKYSICGAICESSDFFAKNRKISSIKRGDFVAIMSSGAYGSSMSSGYNSKPQASEIFLI